MFWRIENELKGRLRLWWFPYTCSPPCPPCSLPCWRDALSQGIHQPADQQGCYTTRPSVVPLLASTARLRKAKHVGILALYLKGSSCSLNNSKDDICVTPHCRTWLMKSSAWSPGSTTPIALPLELQYQELAKSYLSKAETWQKKKNQQQNGRWKSKAFVLDHFILPDSPSRLTSDDQACLWLSCTAETPAQEEKEKAAPSSTRAPWHWNVQDSHCFELVWFLCFCLDNGTVGNHKGLSPLQQCLDKHTPK